jgi:hypothetical protein
MRLPAPTDVGDEEATDGRGGADPPPPLILRFSKGTERKESREKLLPLPLSKPFIRSWGQPGNLQKLRSNKKSSWTIVGPMVLSSEVFN